MEVTLFINLSGMQAHHSGNPISHHTLGLHCLLGDGRTLLPLRLQSTGVGSYVNMCEESEMCIYEDISGAVAVQV